MIYESIGNFAFELMNVASDLDEFLQKAPEFPERKDLSEFYLNLRNFLNIYELLDDHYVVYAEHEQDGRFKLKLYCVDPSKTCRSVLTKGMQLFSFPRRCFRWAIIRACSRLKRIIMQFTQRRHSGKNRNCCCSEMM